MTGFQEIDVRDFLPSESQYPTASLAMTPEGGKKERDEFEQVLAALLIAGLIGIIIGWWLV